MDIAWHLWVVLVSLVASSQGQPSQDVVNVGAIFTFGSINGKVSKIAMKAAEADVNSDPTVLGGRKLSISMHDSNFSGFLGIIGALQFMESDTVAIIGPQNSGMAHVLSHLANQLHVPMLSFTALDPTLSPLQYPYFIQTAPNDLFQMIAIAEIISYYGWGEVVAMYSDDDHSRNGVTILGDVLSDRRCKISYKSALPPDPTSTRDDVAVELNKIKLQECRVIVLHTFSKTGLLVFEMAKELGMMEKGYVWIASTWLSTVLDSNSPLPPSTVATFQGVLTLRPHTAESKRKSDFISRWNEMSNGSIGFNPYALYAYDTVWIIARALKTFLSQGNNISFTDDPTIDGFGRGYLNLRALSIFNAGDKLLNDILQTKMTGLTGPIKFTSDRSLLHPAYDVINVKQDGSQEIGYWTNYSGLSVIAPEILYEKPPNRSSANQHLDGVVWPGGSTSTPRGWVFPNNGRELRIGVPRRVSYRDFLEQINGTDEVRGYCIDVFLAAIELLPYAVPYKFIPFGDGKKNPSYNELVNMIASGIFDAAVGDIAIVTNRTKIADFTQPYAESGLVVVAPVRKLNSSSWTFLRPFTPVMWIVTGAFFLIIGAVVWILEHRINDEFRGPPRDQIVTVLWFSLSTMFFSHRENTVGSLGRMVLIIWLFVVLIINSSYTASLTSILTVEHLSSPISGVDSLISSTVSIGYQVGSFAENYMIDQLSIPKSRLIALGSPEEYASALEDGTVAAVVDEKPYIELFLSNYCKFSIRGQQFTKSGWGFVSIVKYFGLSFPVHYLEVDLPEHFKWGWLLGARWSPTEALLSPRGGTEAFPRDSPLAIDMSTAILALSENGELQKIHDRWLLKKACKGPQGSNAGSDQLNIKSFWGLFLICGIACVLALITYFGLMIRKFSRHQPQESSPAYRCKSPSAWLQTFLSFADEKEDRSRRHAKRKLNDQMGNGAESGSMSINESSTSKSPA